MKVVFSLTLGCVLTALFFFSGTMFQLGVFSDLQAYENTVYAQESLVPTACSGSDGSADCPEGVGEYRPDGYGSCEFVSLINNVMQFLIKMTGVLAVIVFLYAGFLMVSSRGDAATIGQAKSLFANVLIGFVIMLAAFLVINTVLSVLVGGVSGILNWNTIECQYAYKSKPADAIAIELEIEKGLTVPMTSTEGVYPDATLRGADGGTTYVGGDCSPENLQRLGMTATQATTFSCIARPESSCNLNADNPNSTARGVFQILRGYNDTGHNLNFPECTAAAVAKGYKVSGNLNCSRAFSGGQRKSNPNPLADACDVAASNLACNVKAALWLYDHGGAYNPWLGNRGENHHLAQRACVITFDPSKYTY